MFSFFRRGLTAKIMLGVLGLGLLAIVVTGFGTGGSGLGGLGGAGGNTLAVAGDEKVTSVEAASFAERELNNARQQDPELDMGRFLSGGIYESIVNQLISTKALLSFGRDAGLGVSKRLIDGQIASLPDFRNVAGQFDEMTFRSVLASQQMSEVEFRERVETSLIEQQILLPVESGARVPQGIALQYASLLLERRTGSVGLVPAAVMPQGPEPTTAEVAAYYQQQRSRYTIPERRILRYAAIGPEQVANAARPTEQEIQAFYTANAAKYGAQETRDLSQVVLPSQQAAQQFAAKLARGTAFAQAAAEAGFGAGDTRQAGRSRAQFAGVTSASVATAAFSAAEGAVTPPLQSEFGWHLVKVDKINRSAGRGLDSVRAEIAGQLGTQKTQQALQDLVTRIEDAIGEGSSYAEVARQFGLGVQQTPPVTGAGASASAQLPPEAAPLLKAGFEMEADEDPVVETLGPNNYALLQVASIIPAAPPPLAQIAGQVKTDLIAKRRADRARTMAAAIVAKINAGTPVAQAFTQGGVGLPPVQPVNARRLEISQGGDRVPPPLAMMFSMKRGTAKVLEAPNGAGWFVVHLATTETGDASKEPGLVRSTRQEFGRVLGQEYSRQFSNAVEKQLKVKRNSDAIAAGRKQLLGPGAQ
ncbi:MAG: peptidyl-prolyl cis-trans isomerase [Sphingosinicella sp.]|nr:peptidyl-prolyl cis-trans isomerase [Sphingosinicella sp.]